jgi:septal ring-binding cell division protein DamX
MSKIAFILVVLLFGVSMFVAGLLAPAALHSATHLSLRHSAQPWLPPALAKLLDGGAKSAGAASAAGASGAAAAPAAASAPAAIALGSMLVPATPQANSVYALQVALVATTDQANASAAPFSDAQMPVKILNVTTSDGKAWVLVAAGSYGSYDDARTAQTVLAQQFHLVDLPPVIVLPPPKPAA